jgi:hypothetical protein
MAGRTACPLRGAVRAEMTLALATTHQHVTRFTHLVTSHQRDETPQRPRPTTAPIVNTTDSSLARADPVITARNPCHEPICMSPSGVSRFFTVFTHILLDTRPPFFCSRAYRALYFFFWAASAFPCFRACHAPCFFLCSFRLAKTIFTLSHLTNSVNRTTSSLARL